MEKILKLGVVLLLIRMRKFLLVFSVLLVALLLSSFMLIQSLGLTVLNETYVLQKIEEGELYNPLINAVSSDYTGPGIDLAEFIEVIGNGAAKPLVKSVVSGTLLYLKDPRVNSVEIGVPAGLFPVETTISLDQVLSKEQVNSLSSLKLVVQSLSIFKNIALLVAISFILVIIVSAKGFASKARWLGFSLLIAGVLVICLSFFSHGFFQNLIDLNAQQLGSVGVVLAPLLKGLVSDYSSIAQTFGLALFFIGVFTAWIAVTLIRKIRGKNGFIEEKEEKEKIRALKIREKMR